MYKIQPKTLFTGKNTIYLPSCHSTNAYASEKILKEEVLEGQIFITSDQTAGKGQRGNIWTSQAGKNLTFSLVYRPSFLPIDQQFYLNMSVCLAIHATLAEFLDENLKIKWPNDIYYHNKKMGGVLIESTLTGQSLQYTIIGIGLNINQTDFELPSATSLKQITGEENSLELILSQLCEQLEHYYEMLKKGKDQQVFKEYQSLLFQKDDWHWYEDKNGRFEGKIEGVDSRGAIIMMTKLGLKQYEHREFQFIIE